MTSVVIAAHDEERVIAGCLEALACGAAPDALDVTVVANGCSDATAAVARRSPGVRVLDLEQPGKTNALNAGDAVALGFPRVYLDADMMVSGDEVRAVADALEQEPEARVAFPARRIDSEGCAWAVRAYFAINARLPVFRRSAFGRGMIVLSAAGRRRFGQFPDIVADDLFLDGLFSTSEKLLVESVVVTVAAPRTTDELLGRLVRVRRGNAAVRRAAADGGLARNVIPARRASWLVDVVLPRPWLAPAAVVYVVLTLVAARRARREPIDSGAWGRGAATTRRSTGSGARDE